MTLFKLTRHHAYVADAKTYARFELLHTSIDLAAAILFVIGSIMFFFDSWQQAGTWCFLVGSICFALKPTLRILREMRYAKNQDFAYLAKRYKDE